MIQFQEAIARIEELLWVPTTIEMRGEKQTALLFDLSAVDEEEFADLLEDLFCDGIPEAMDFRRFIPFMLIGPYEEQITEGTLDAIMDPTAMLLFDMAEGSAEALPVWMIEVDGTAIADTFAKVVDDVMMLPVKETLLG